MPNQTTGEPVARCMAVPVTYTHPTLNSTDPDDLLAELLSDLLASRPINPLSAWWLERGILNAIRRDEPLDLSLALAGRGRDTLQRRLLMLRRNQYLELALEAIADESVTRWIRCTRLAEQIPLFKRYAWPRTRYLTAPPDDWPTYKKCLWAAAATDIDLPESAGTLRQIILQKPAFSGNNRGATLLSQFL